MTNAIDKRIGRSRIGGDGWGKLASGERRRANRASRRAAKAKVRA